MPETLMLVFDGSATHSFTRADRHSFSAFGGIKLVLAENSSREAKILFEFSKHIPDVTMLKAALSPMRGIPIGCQPCRCNLDQDQEDINQTK
jgi:hypothetical protein